MKIQATHATCWSFFQAASVIHLTVSPSGGKAVTKLLGILLSGGKVLEAIVSPWALLHYFAKRISFIAVSSGDISRFSKIKVFLEVQLVLQIHGRTLSEISEGGRQGIFLKAITTSLKVFTAAMWTSFSSGIFSQTFWENKQVKKVWTADSVSWHRRQYFIVIRPLVYWFSPRGNAFWRIGHKKIFIFGEYGPVHTSLIQLKPSGEIMLSCEIACIAFE